MAKVKKTESAELTEAKKELAHWKQYCDNQGYDSSKPHQYSDTLANLEKRIKDLSNVKPEAEVEE